MKNIITIFSLFLLSVTSAFAQLPVKIQNGSGVERITAAAGSEFNSGMTAITTGGVDIATATTKLQVLFCRNSTGTPRTLTMADKAGSPNTYLPAVSVPANTAMLMVSTVVGLPMSGGITLTAEANSAIACQAVGVQ